MGDSTLPYATNTTYTIHKYMNAHKRMQTSSVVYQAQTIYTLFTHMNMNTRYTASGHNNAITRICSARRTANEKRTRLCLCVLRGFKWYIFRRFYQILAIYSAFNYQASSDIDNIPKSWYYGLFAAFCFLSFPHSCRLPIGYEANNPHMKK